MRRVRAVLSGCIVAAAAAGVWASDSLDALRTRFVAPPPGSGTITLWWLNGTLTKPAIREHLLALRDRDGFGGVAPLTLFRMKPATEPEYLTDGYFEMYGHILDTCRELGMSVVFYDDCDFPSGTAGNRMAEQFPEHLMKYLARGVVTAAGPCEVSIPMPTGTLMSAVARNLDGGGRTVVTRDVAWSGSASAFAGGSAGFRQPPEESAVYEFLRIVGADGKVLFEERFSGADQVADRWKNPGASRAGAAGLRANDCLPMWVDGLKLPEQFTLESRFTILQGAAGLAFGVRGADDLAFWQFHAGHRALRPHLKQGRYRTLPAVALSLETNRAYDVKIAVDGTKVETWLDGKQVASHTVEGRSDALRWAAPAGRWELQAFVCATAPGRRFVDCLDAAAMEKFIGLTYDRFAARFPEHFGTTIRMSFYDDLAVYHVPECTMWTPSYNARFRERFGREPDALYPALWEDIGPDTAAARASLLGLRNDLFARGYPALTGAWCARRGVTSSGHPAASYRANPLQGPGDAILFYRDQGCPLTDYIHYYDHGIDGFKVPASAAYNFDKPVVVCEIYGNFHQGLPNDSNMLYRAAMEMYARGINLLLPHGTWWNDKEMRIVPEISWRNPAIGPELPRFNRWAARCESLLRGGRHVADIGVLYPIADLAARYHIGLLPFTHGKDPVPGSDYYEIMRILTGEIRRDFTMLHPETVIERCRADGAEFVLDHPGNWERYKVILLPACRTIHAAVLEKVKAFHDGGGKVIATTCLPEQSAEFGRDADVRRLAAAIFGPGGHGVFVARPDEPTLKAALDGLGLAWDVCIENAPDLPRTYRKAHDYGGVLRADPDAYEGGNRQFAYIHKVKDGADLYYFANSSALTVTADVTLLGGGAVERWDPRTGSVRPESAARVEAAGSPARRVKLELPPLGDAFLVSPAR